MKNSLIFYSSRERPKTRQRLIFCTLKKHLKNQIQLSLIWSLLKASRFVIFATEMAKCTCSTQKVLFTNSMSMRVENSSTTSSLSSLKRTKQFSKLSKWEQCWKTYDSQKGQWRLVKKLLCTRRERKWTSTAVKKCSSPAAIWSSLLRMIESNSTAWLTQRADKRLQATKSSAKTSFLLTSYRKSSCLFSSIALSLEIMSSMNARRNTLG